VNLFVKDGRAAVHLVHLGEVRELPPGNTIVLEYREGQWQRRIAPLEVEGVLLALKQPPAEPGLPLMPGILYNRLFN
ncbi:MAG: hypothetical protein ABI972_27345, partial [Acidobacteriota bacterium]